MSAAPVKSKDQRLPSVTPTINPQAHCRFCGHPLKHTFVDLGMSPPCQNHVTVEQLNHMEAFYPLHALVCEKCFLVQLEEYVAPADIFSEYAYFSSYTDSWVAHAKGYCELVQKRFLLGRQSKVVEIASNDGYLLQHFVAMGIPVLGVEPAANVAKVAVEKGIPAVVKFFGRKTATEVVHEHGRADLLLGNNVLAHVPDLNDFVSGMKVLLGPTGVITMEFPHLYQLMKFNQFDTIYHEHFSYFSFLHGRASLQGARHRAVRRRGNPHARRLAAHLWTSHGRCVETDLATRGGPAVTGNQRGLQPD